MSNAAIIAIAIAVAVVLAAIVFVTTARRSDVRGAGALSSETRRRDEAARSARAAAEAVGSEEPSRPGTAVAVLSADEAERAGDEARRPTPVLAPPAAPVPWVPPDPEVIGVSRRQFFNRATVTLMGTSIGAFTVAGFVAFLWPTATGGFGQVVSVGKLEDILEGARANSGFFYAPSARTWFTEYPAEALPDAEAHLRPADLRRDARLRPRRPLPEVPTPRLSGPRLRDRAAGSSARATVRSTTRSARRRAGPRRAAWTASASASMAPATSPSTRAPSSPDRRSARTPRVRRPRVRTASPVPESTDAEPTLMCPEKTKFGLFRAHRRNQCRCV